MNSSEECRSRSGDLRRLGIIQTHFKTLLSQQDIEKSCINEGWTLIVVTEQGEGATSNIFLILRSVYCV